MPQFQVSLADVITSRGYHPSVQARLEQADKGAENGPDSQACQADAAYREQFRAAVLKEMEKDRLDAFVYPTWSNVPRLIGDLNSPAGDNSQVFSPITGWPAINVLMGFSRGGMLPAGMTIFGKAWSEATLIKYAYAYEQATGHRRARVSTPPLR
jgi:amidase